MDSHKTDSCHILLLSGLAVENTTAGNVILWRHLSSLGDKITYSDIRTEPPRRSLAGIMRRILGKASKGPLKRFAEDLFFLWDGRWVDNFLPKQIDRQENAVVLTVAHGEFCGAAVRFAKRHALPLVVIFHDWWPDLYAGHSILRDKAEKKFRYWYDASTIALCVSDGMRQQLGDHPDARVLYPIPGQAGAAGTPGAGGNTGQDGKVSILYSGNLGDYGDLLKQALLHFKDSTKIQFQVRGVNRDWDDRFVREMTGSGNLLPFAERDEFERWLAEGDAFLIPMSFEPGMKKRMMTSFPSKIADYARYGKPLIIWGPDYCSAVKWGSDENKALCVTSERVEELEAAMERTLLNQAECDRLKEGAYLASKNVFDAARLQECFESAIIHASGKP